MLAPRPPGSAPKTHRADRDPDGPDTPLGHGAHLPHTGMTGDWASAHSGGHTSVSSPATSEGLGAGRVCHVGSWLLGVAGEGVGLSQDGQVHQHLQ